MISKDGLTQEEYKCKKEWPENIFIQHGSRGLVISKKENGTYRTAFFEVFNTNLTESYIRGEGENVEEAEKNAFNKYLKMKNCKKHNFVRKNNNTLDGVCSSCNTLKKDIMDQLPEIKCSVCNKESAYFGEYKGKDKIYFCLEHYYENKKNDFFKLKEKIDTDTNIYSSNLKSIIFSYLSVNNLDFITRNLNDKESYLAIKKHRKNIEDYFHKCYVFVLEKAFYSGFFENRPKYINNPEALDLFFKDIVKDEIFKIFLKQEIPKDKIFKQAPFFEVTIKGSDSDELLMKNLKIKIKEEIDELIEEDKSVRKIK